jgi:uncharacterized protein with PhoU and TrkA domain
MADAGKQLAGGQGEDALDMTKRGDRVMLRSAIRRWPLDDARKARYLARLDEALEIADSARDIASVVRTAVAMEACNQADEHLDAKNQRIDEGKPTEAVVIEIPPPRTLGEA